MKSLHLEDEGIGYLESQSLIEQLKQSKDTHKWLLDRLNEIEKYDLLDYLYNTKLLLQAVEEKWDEQKKKYAPILARMEELQKQKAFL